MYEKCIKCDRLGKDCIPNLYVMDVEEIRDWARKLKDEKGWTNAELAKMSGVPKGTIDSNFSRHPTKHADVNYSTFAPILCALIGCTKDELPCFGNHEQENTERIHQLEGELKQTKQEYEERIAYFKEHMKWRKHIIMILIAICCVLLLCVIAELAVDFANRNMGFFWR